MYDFTTHKIAEITISGQHKRPFRNVIDVHLREGVMRSLNTNVVSSSWVGPLEDICDAYLDFLMILLKLLGYIFSECYMRGFEE